MEKYTMFGSIRLSNQMFYKYIFFLFAIFLMVSCDPDELRNPSDRYSLVIVNSTGQNLYFKCNFGEIWAGSYQNKQGALPYGNSAKIWNNEPFPRQSDNVSFSCVLEGIMEKCDVGYFSLFSIGDNWELCDMVKEWRTNMKTESHDFFNVSSWKLDRWSDDGLNYYEWTFTILPKDLETSEEAHEVCSSL